MNLHVGKYRVRILHGTTFNFEWAVRSVELLCRVLHQQNHSSPASLVTPRTRVMTRLVVPAMLGFRRWKGVADDQHAYRHRDDQHIREPRWIYA